MIKVKDFYSENGRIYATFLSNGLTLSVVCTNDEVANRNNTEVVDYLYSKVTTIVTDWCTVNSIQEDTVMGYPREVLLKVAENPPDPLPTEIAIRNEQNLRFLELQQTQRLTERANRNVEEIGDLKDMLLDIAGLLITPGVVSGVDPRKQKVYRLLIAAKRIKIGEVPEPYHAAILADGGLKARPERPVKE